MFISQTESALHTLAAAAISTSLFVFGLRGTPARDRQTNARRIKRWPSIVGGVIGVGMTAFVAAVENFQLGNVGLSFPILLAVLIAGLVGAFVLMRKGLRGRRVGDHPYCRACGFDLFGKPADSHLCNECGTPLDAPTAIVVGVRQRRMVLLSLGIFIQIVVLAAAVPLVTDGYQRLAKIDWNPHKPTSWLISDMRSGSQSNASQQELYRRMSEGKVSGDQLREIIRVVAAKPLWPGAFAWAKQTYFTSSVARQGWRNGRLDGATVRPLIREALNLHLEVAKQAARGHVLRYWVASPDFGLMQHAPDDDSTLAVTHLRVLLNGSEVPTSAIDAATLNFDAMNVALAEPGTQLRLDGVSSPPPLGPASLEIHLTATLTVAATERPLLVESRDLVLTGTTTIVESSAMRCPPVVDGPADPSRPIDDPINTAAVPKPIAPDPLPEAIAAKEGEKWMLRLKSTAGTNGLLLGDVYLQSAGREERIGGVCLSSYDDTVLPLGAEPPADAEIVIEPTPERGVELFEVVPSYQVPIVVPLTKQ